MCYCTEGKAHIYHLFPYRWGGVSATVHVDDTFDTFADETSKSVNNEQLFADNGHLRLKPTTNLYSVDSYSVDGTYKMACKSNRVLVTAPIGHSWQQQSIHTAACGQPSNDYDDINGRVETVETTFLYTGGSVNVTGCGVRLGANSEKGTLRAAAFEAVTANYMAPALVAVVDDCRDEASYTSMELDMVIDACG